MKEIKKDNCRLKLNGLKAKILPALISSSMILSMSGCSTKKNTPKYLKENGFEVTQLNDLSKDYDLYLVDSVDINKVSDDRLKDNVNDFLMNYIQADPIEYFNYSSKKDANKEDIIRLIENNTYLKDEDKKVLSNATNKLDASDIKLNYHVLYDNLNGLKVDYFDEASENMRGSAYGWFSATDRTIHIPTEKYLREFNSNGLEHIKNFVLVHELLGHGSMTYVDHERKVCCSVSKQAYLLHDDGSNIMELGHFVEEGCADIIAINSVGKAEAGYPLCDYFVKTLESSLDLSFNDIYHQGSKIIDKKFNDINIKNGYDVLCSYDNLVSVFLYTDHEMILEEESISMCFMNIYKAYISKLHGEGLSNEEIMSKVKDMIYSYSELMTSNGYDGTILALQDFVHGCLYVSPDHLYNSCEMYLNTLSATNNQRKKA